MPVSVLMGQLRTFLWPTQDIPEVRLVSAKARVAPLRQSTIPRLELINGSPHLLKTRRDRLRRIQSKTRNCTILVRLKDSATLASLRLNVFESICGCSYSRHLVKLGANELEICSH